MSGAKTFGAKLFADITSAQFVTKTSGAKLSGPNGRDDTQGGVFEEVLIKRC